MPVSVLDPNCVVDWAYGRVDGAHVCGLEGRVLTVEDGGLEMDILVAFDWAGPLLGI